MLEKQFIDQVRDRTVLSELIGQTLKLEKVGREFKACCPFHSEKSASFTISDEKGFAHCFGCGWHGDVFRWLADDRGLEFIDAVRELAERAGLAMPAPSSAQAERAAQVETLRGAIEVAQAAYVRQLFETGAAMEYLGKRGLGPFEIATFGIGFARGGAGTLRGLGIGERAGQGAGLLVPRTDGQGLREQFWDRITIPIHDHRGQLVGFTARVWPGRRTQEPKFINSPEGPLFDKGRTLFNLHRASPAARPIGTGAQGEGRLLVVEGALDVIALARCGINAAVAPMGTALTLAQLTRAWRVHNRPVLLFDGDTAGRKAGERACRIALPALAPGRELAIGSLPDGADPDDLVRELGEAAARRAIEAAQIEARSVHDFLFDAVLADKAGGGGDASPEARAAVWAELAALAAEIGDDETRAQYLGVWRARFERECSAVPVPATVGALHSVQRADDGADYCFPESESDSQARLIQIVRAMLRKRAERKALGEEIADIARMAKAIGFDPREINAVVRDIESDLANGSGPREESEMTRVLYRRALGIRGPMTEAMLPPIVDGRARVASQASKRRASMLALVDAGGLGV